MEQKIRLRERKTEEIRPQDQTAEEIFVISLIDSYRDEIHTRYQEIYMPL